MADIIEVDAQGFHGETYKGAARLIYALFERDSATVEAARGRLTTLAPIAPELRRWMTVPAEVEAAIAVSREGNRQNWSQRVAHGLTDFVLDCVGAEARPMRLTVRNLGPEPLDLEFFRILGRRADPERFVLNLVASTGPPPEPDTADPQTLTTLARRAMDLAYYEAALEWVARAEAALNPGEAHPLRARIFHEKLFALLLMDRLDEVEALCAAGQRDGADPAIRVDAGYAQAILYARFYEQDRRDYRAARACVEAALAAAAAMPPGDPRVVNTAFLHNTLALVELREGRPDVALTLLTGAIAQIAREAPASFAREATILFQNRARLHRGQGRQEAALADLQRFCELEPGAEEAWFDRAVILQGLGRHAEALADYDRAILWGPPQVATLHNRAQCLRELGQLGEARTALGRVLEIDPDHLAARIDRACLNQVLGDLDAMARDVEDGLRRAPDDARLLCLAGIVATLEGRNAAALARFDAALDRQPEFADAWANRALVHARRGDNDEALADLDRALALRDDPAIRRNRQRILARTAHAPPR